MDEGPWYRDGLRFTCTGCGDCCTGFPGHVYVTQPEIDAIAARIGMTPDEVERKFTIAVGERRSLRDLPQADYDCVFFDGETRRCRVYEARPIQCRTFPFWDSNLVDRRAWEKTCRGCPGSGVGELYTVEQIDARRAEVDV